MAQVLFTIPVIIAFIVIYRRYKAEKEDNLLLKLIGYYLLGSFRFNFNNFALPAGFAAFLLFFRPQHNKPVKNAMAALGLAAFVCGLIIPAAQKAYFERQRVVAVSDTNIYTNEFSSDFNAIKQKFGIITPTNIEDFDASFENSGAIKELRYSFLTRDNKGIVLYHVNYSSEKKRYSIKPTRVKEWLQYDRLINDQQFFSTMDKLDLKQIKPQEEYPYYTIKCAGDYSNWAVKDWDNFLITDNGYKRLKNEELPVGGYAFWIFGNKKTNETNYTSYSSESNRAYILPVPK